MTKNLKVGFGALAMAMILLVPMAAFALQDVQPITSIDTIEPPTSDSGITSANGVLVVLVQVLGYVQAFFWVAAVFFGLYAAFLYLTAQGNGEKISRANNMLVYVVVAVIVAVVAYSIPAFVKTTITS